MKCYTKLVQVAAILAFGMLSINASALNGVANDGSVETLVIGDYTHRDFPIQYILANKWYVALDPDNTVAADNKEDSEVAGVLTYNFPMCVASNDPSNTFALDITSANSGLWLNASNIIPYADVTVNTISLGNIPVDGATSGAGRVITSNNCDAGAVPSQNVVVTTVDHTAVSPVLFPGTYTDTITIKVTPE